MSERDLDRMVADALYKRVPAPAHWKCDAEYAYQIADNNLMCPLCQLPWYEGDIEAAFLLVNVMRERGFTFFGLEYQTVKWCARFVARNPTRHSGPGGIANGPTAPRAICLAALAALEDSNE